MEKNRELLQDEMFVSIVKYLAERGISAEDRQVRAANIPNNFRGMVEQFRIAPLPIPIPEQYIALEIMKHNLNLGRHFISGPGKDKMTYDYHIAYMTLHRYLVTLSDESLRISAFRLGNARELIEKLESIS